MHIKTAFDQKNTLIYIYIFFQDSAMKLYIYIYKLLHILYIYIAYKKTERIIIIQLYLRGFYVCSHSKCTGCAFNGYLPPRLTWSRHLVTFNPDLALCLPTPLHQARFHPLMLLFQALLRKAAFPRVCRQVGMWKHFDEYERSHTTVSETTYKQPIAFVLEFYNILQ